MDKTKKEIKDKVDGSQGIYGWLLFYVAVQIIAVIWTTAAYTLFPIGPSHALFLVYLFTTVLPVYSTILIFQKKKSAIKWNVAQLWLFALALPALEIYSTYHILGLHTVGTTGENAIWSRAKAAIYGNIPFFVTAFIWTVYLLKSKRVRATLIK